MYICKMIRKFAPEIQHVSDVIMSTPSVDFLTSWFWTVSDSAWWTDTALAPGCKGFYQSLPA